MCDPEAEWPGHAVRLRSQRVLLQALACLVRAGSPKPQSSLLQSHPACVKDAELQRLTHWCCGGTGLPLACHLRWPWPQSSFRWMKNPLRLARSLRKQKLRWRLGRAWRTPNSKRCNFDAGKGSQHALMHTQT